MTIETLMKQAGVTAEDIQVVANAHPEIISKIGGGKTCTALAVEAGKRGMKSIGYCARGTREIFQATPSDTLSRVTINSGTYQAARDEYRQNINRNNGGFKGNDSGADSMYVGFEASGNFVSIDIINTACGKAPGPECNENIEMNTYIKTVQPGVTVTWDCFSGDDRSKFPSQARTAGGKWGHAAVKRKDGKFQCDFTQASVPFTRYGPKVHAIYPKDAFISKEYALLLIQQAQERANNPNYQYSSDVRKRTVARKSTAQRGKTTTPKKRVASQRKTTTPKKRVASPRKTTTPKKRVAARGNTSAKTNYVRKVASQKKGRV